MTETLSTIFQRTRGAPIEVSGRLVQPIFEKTIETGQSNFFAHRLGVSNEVLTGLRLKSANGYININNQRYTDVILWSDTSPESVYFSVVAKKAGVLKIWNVWRADNIIQAWVGNTGIMVSEEAQGKLMKLECSGGTETADFTTLIYEIKSIS
ncbi:hypothetical protein [Pseudomonas syringae]|uniref:hypothetical protein n=1 Tax=Pseudomonas syringae TaxID=317 RepID=UPI00126879AC|nr:hypothetical protein [Pseudomonas syringae]